jgi:hypothetical protein
MKRRDQEKEERQTRGGEIHTHSLHTPWIQKFARMTLGYGITHKIQSVQNMPNIQRDAIQIL